MRSRVAFGLLLGFGLASSVRAALAGAWTLEAGTGQLIITDTLSQGVDIFNAARSLQSAPRYTKNELQGLLEYGATDRFTVILEPMLQHVDIGAPVDAQRSGLGYTELGGRVRLFQGDSGGGSWVISGQTTLRVPGTFDRSNPAALGYTDTQLDVRALFGYTFKAGAWPAFIDVQVAQRFSFGWQPDEFRTDITFGVRPAPQWLLLVQSFNVISEGAGTWGLPSYDYSKLQLSGVYSVTPALSLQLGAFTAYTGRNALQENGLVLGAWYKF
jgi:protein XagA